MKNIKDKKLTTTPCKKNCWLKLTYENPLGFSWFVFYLLTLLLKSRNFPYTTTLGTSKNDKPYD